MSELLSAPSNSQARPPPGSWSQAGAEAFPAGGVRYQRTSTITRAQLEGSFCETTGARWCAARAIEKRRTLGAFRVSSYAACSYSRLRRPAGSSPLAPLAARSVAGSVMHPNAPLLHVHSLRSLPCTRRLSDTSPGCRLPGHRPHHLPGVPVEWNDLCARDGPRCTTISWASDRRSRGSP